MDTHSQFYPQAVTRSTTGSCAGLAAFIFILFLTGASVLWHFAGEIRHTITRASDKAAETTLPSVNANLDEQIKNAAQGVVNDQKEKATDAIKKEATHQLEEQSKNIQDQVQNQINDKVKDVLK